MTIGILYESKEWSSFALCDNINALGVPAMLIDMQEEIDINEIRSCSLILNRVFASAVFRGHQRALDQIPRVIELLSIFGIPMINTAAAHYYEISKTHTKQALAEQGFQVPKQYDILSPEYPCVVKPDCGGRTSYTFIVNNEQELYEIINNAPDIWFIAEEYIRPSRGYITRIEVIDGACRLALKRSVTEGGLSAYHLGSEYEFYNDLSRAIKDTAVMAMDLLGIGAGSMDIIENETGFYIIDVNSVSNASEDNTEMFEFDLMKETAAYAVKIYNNL